MPIYEYVCRGCGNRFEELVSSHHAEVLCPSCHANDAERLLSLFAAGRSELAAASSCSRPECAPGFG